MRDDIHKGAQVSPTWRSFIKHSAREVDWQSKAPLSAEKAVASLAREISPQLLKALKAAVADQQIELLTSHSRLEEIRMKMPLCPLERSVIDRLAEEACHQSLSDDSLQKCLHGALRERIEAEMRSVEVHAQAASPRDRRELIQRMRLALSKTDVEKAFGPSPSKISKQKQAERVFNWDEEIGVR
jgi:hypothetical protein